MRPSARRYWLAGGVAGLTMLGGLALAPLAGALTAVPLAVPVAAVVWLAVSGDRQRLLWPVGVAGAVSVACTVLFLLGKPGGDERGALLGMVEVAALLLLATAAIRWAPARLVSAWAGLAGLAESLWILRYMTQQPGVSPLELVAGCALWSVPLAGAAIAGGYPRLAEYRRERAVTEARQEQRLALAADLHDYVAHDVSGMVALAQAGRMVAATNPEALAGLLERIEEAGQHALTAMDRAVGTLRTGEGAREPVPGLEELPGLVERFAQEGTGKTDLDFDLEGDVPRDVGSTAYRIVVEALTNVRRHAAGATAVRVSVRREGEMVRVSVADSGGAGTPRAEGGSGLAGLTERVGLLGGTLEAGPEGSGWRVSAALPGRTRA